MRFNTGLSLLSSLGFFLLPSSVIAADDEKKLEAARMIRGASVEGKAYGAVEIDYLPPCPYRGGCGSYGLPIYVNGCVLRVEHCNDEFFYLDSVYNGRVIVDGLSNSSFTKLWSVYGLSGSVLNITQDSSVEEVINLSQVDYRSKVEISSGSNVKIVTFGYNYGRIVAPGVPGSGMFGTYVDYYSCVVNSDGWLPNVLYNKGKVTTSEDQCDATADAMTSYSSQMK